MQVAIETMKLICSIGFEFEAMHINKNQIQYDLLLSIKEEKCLCT